MPSTATAVLADDVETRRLAALGRYGLVGTAPEPRFDELAQLAAEICDAPIGLISLVDADQLWFKSRYQYVAESAPRSGSFCEQVIVHNKPLIIEDASKHALFSTRPMVNCPDGVRFYAGIPLRTASGEAIGVLCTLDHTPRQLTERQRHTMEILSRQVMAQMELLRTAREAREEACHLSEINQNKDRYMAILAHDLRSSFHGIMAFSEVLDTEFEDMDTSAIRKIASYLNHASHSTYGLLENLLEWSLLTSDSMAFKPRWIKLSTLLGEISDSVLVNAQQKDIAITLPTHDCEEIYGDPNMLRSLIQNLLSNAIKFTPKGGTVSVDCQRRAGDLLQVSVTDTGVGMSPERVATLFQSSIGQSTRGTSGEHGTGLGLSLCQQFVSRHGGRIWATSTPEVGTTIHFELPQPQPSKSVA